MSRVPWRAVTVAVWAALSVVAAVLLLNAQQQSARELKQRLGDRSEVSARFVKTYTDDLMARERRVAEHELGDDEVSPRQFARVNQLFGYEAAVLLDGRGRALQVAPAAPELLGKDLTDRYDHLRAAAHGRVAVSKVVPSATTGVPIVAFAMPFDTPQGRRVFSGAFDVATTPIGAYLRNATAVPGARVYLLDRAGAVIASNRRELRGVNRLSSADPALATALRHHDDGDAASYSYASRPVGGTSWRLVMSLPTKQLLAPVTGFRRYVPWLVWTGFVLGGLAVAILLGHLMLSRRRLGAAKADLDRLARVDPVTDLYNRRQMQAELDAAVAASDRHGTPLSVLVIDVDHFKAINDVHGHWLGDAVLKTVAERLRSDLRVDDVVGRWGGEEFLALLPHTDRGEAEVVAERMRAVVAAEPIMAKDVLVRVSVSIGLAQRLDESPDALVAEADQAMYKAKSAGRDGVRSA